MTALWKTIVKVGVFGVVMILLTAALFAIFSASIGRVRTTHIRRCSPTPPA